MSDHVPGFRFGGITCGIKASGKPDLALLLTDDKVPAAGVFTQNRVRAAPVLLSEERVRGGYARGVLVNSGNANACTGEAGRIAAEIMTRDVAGAAGFSPKRLLVASTGIIGVPLPVEKISMAREELVSKTHEGGFLDFATAILTTDKGPKIAAREVTIGATPVRLLGCTKGAGMIAPNMATTLAFVATDAAVDPRFLRKALRAGAAASFNEISVDGDTSTNDSLYVLASGRAENRRIDGGKAGRIFAATLRELLEDLAIQIVRDGEGATHVVTIEVQGAPSARAAEKVARRVGASPLVKTAVFGADPNWGRIVGAVGNAGVRFDTSKLEVWIGDAQIVKAGAGTDSVATDAAHAVMKQPAYTIRIDLQGGKGRGRHITCDLTHEYVTINAEYRT